MSRSGCIAQHGAGLVVGGHRLREGAQVARLEAIHADVPERRENVQPQGAVGLLDRRHAVAVAGRV
jgi:hypothetical protein